MGGRAQGVCARRRPVRLAPHDDSCATPSGTTTAVGGHWMKDATRKATSTRKDVSAAFAQMLAIVAMLVIAGFVFYAR